MSTGFEEIRKCHVCQCTDKPAHRISARCVSRKRNRVYLCTEHKFSEPGYLEVIRCVCLKDSKYFSVYDPCSCMGKPHDGLPMPKKLCSGYVYRFPYKTCSRTEIPSSLRCSSCEKEIQNIDVYAKCSSCDDMYCNPSCTMRMATIFMRRDNGLYEAVCFSCDPEPVD
jgi:hypothetical protein